HRLCHYVLSHKLEARAVMPSVDFALRMAETYPKKDRYPVRLVDRSVEKNGRSEYASRAAQSISHSLFEMARCGRISVKQALPGLSRTMNIAAAADDSSTAANIGGIYVDFACDNRLMAKDRIPAVQALPALDAAMQLAKASGKSLQVDR